mgnify:CR=1 FL=1
MSQSTTITPEIVEQHGLSPEEYEREIAFVRETLGNLAPTEAHWQEYLAAWT